MPLRLILASAVITLLLGACGRGSSKPTANGGVTALTPNAEADQALAESAVLTLSDFPKGTTETPRAPPAANDPIAACNPQHPSGSTGHAESSSFSRGERLSDIESDVYVFDSAENATAWAAQYRAAVIGCVANVINTGKANTTTAFFSNASVKEVSFATPPGSQLQAFRLEFSGGPSPAKTSAIVIDGAVITIGRVVCVVDGGPFGFSPNEISPYLNRAVELVHQKIVH